VNFERKVLGIITDVYRCHLDNNEAEDGYSFFLLQVL
jgi:hypothetical protein